MVERYPVRHLLATDNILAMDHFKTLLPRLAHNAPWGAGQVDLFVEVKANLTRTQIHFLGLALPPTTVPTKRERMLQMRAG